MCLFIFTLCCILAPFHKSRFMAQNGLLRHKNNHETSAYVLPLRTALSIYSHNEWDSSANTECDFVHAGANASVRVMILHKPWKKWTIGRLMNVWKLDFASQMNRSLFVLMHALYWHLTTHWHKAIQTFAMFSNISELSSIPTRDKYILLLSKYDAY